MSARIPPHRPGLKHSYSLTPDLFKKGFAYGDEWGFWYKSDDTDGVDLITSHNDRLPAMAPQPKPGTNDRLPPINSFMSPAAMRANPLAPRDANTASPSRAAAHQKVAQHPVAPNSENFALPKQSAPAPLRKRPAAAPKSTAAATPAATNSKKRKIAADEPDIKAIMFPDDAPEIDEDDPRLDILDKGYSCQMVRKKIKAWVDSGAQKVGEFQKEVGIGSKSYGNFMNRQGTWAGEQCDLYMLAARFFRTRELQGLPLAVPAKAKKAKTDKAADNTSKKSPKAADELLDVSGVELAGEAGMVVQVYATCNEMRKHIRDLQSKGITQAAICRAFTASYPDGSGRSVSATNMRSFMNNKGVMGGNTSSVFYGGYVFFEKKRVKEGKAKSKFREEMEKVHKNGVDVEHNMNGPFMVLAGESISIDRYGRIDISQR